MGRIFDVTLVQVTLRMAVPLILASIGGILCAQVNVFNIALEAMMLVGALFGVVGGYLWGGTWYAGGLLTALAAGLICAGGVFALFTIRLKGGHPPIIVGVALNLLAGGLTVVLMRVFFKGRGFFLLEIPLLPTFKLLGGLPPQNILYWAAFTGIILCHLFLYYTSWGGLRMRAVGLKPVAAMTTGGVSPEIYQYAAVLASGLFCGAAGGPGFPLVRSVCLRKTCLPAGVSLPWPRCSLGGPLLCGYWFQPLFSVSRKPWPLDFRAGESLPI